LLVHGLPGVGKSKLIDVISHSSAVPFKMIDISDMYSISCFMIHESSIFRDLQLLLAFTISFMGYVLFSGQFSLEYLYLT